MKKENCFILLINSVIIFFIIIIFSPKIIAYNYPFQLCNDFPYGPEGPGCPSSLQIQVQAPSENYRNFGSPVSISCNPDFHEICENTEALEVWYLGSLSCDILGPVHPVCKWNLPSNGIPEVIAASLDTICAGQSGGGKEGNYYFKLSAGNYGECVSPPLYLRWDLYEPWCIGPSCGRGDWIPVVESSYCFSLCGGLNECYLLCRDGAGTCCSPRTMDLSTHKYTNHDCNLIVQDNLCYFRENATLVEPSTAGRWLKASDFTGEIVYEECG
ncbi:MAG: hypothetical protein ACMXYG_01555, partial [Candidatus Woesearchaeota archaeon]